MYNTRYDIWQEKAMKRYGIPLDVMDSTTKIYRSLKEKYYQMESILEDSEILSDLITLSEYYPLLGKVCLEQGTKTISRRIEDMDIQKITDKTQAAIKNTNNDVTATFLNTDDSSIAREILDNFYLEDEYNMVDTKFIQSIERHDVSFVDYILGSGYPISYGTIASAMKHPNATEQQIKYLSNLIH